MRNGRAGVLVPVAVIILAGVAWAHASDSVVKASMEARAAEMLAEEERNEDMLHRQAEVSEHPDLGESEDEEDDPPAPWEEDKRAQAKNEQIGVEESHIEQAMREYDGKESTSHTTRAAFHEKPRLQARDEDTHGDLGESADVQAETQASDANTLTSRAQEVARTQTKMHQKSAQYQKAKQIADRVRKLVKHQQKLETMSGHSVPGSVLGDAVQEHDKAAEISARDELLAHKLEDQQAQHAMQHLIESEREQQRASFERERETTHTLLSTVRQKLHLEQDKLVKQVHAETSSAIQNVEKELSKSSLAQTIEEVVKKKLARRLSELKAAGERTVHDVTAQVQTLKHRVRRLRRQQTRMRTQESLLEQKQAALRESRSTRDLGESSSFGNSMSTAIDRMHFEQMMRQMQQPQMQQQQQPQPQDHTELMQMREQMAEMKKQNKLLQDLVASKLSSHTASAAAAHPEYTHTGLQNFFKRRSKKATLLKQKVLEERKRLNKLTAMLKDSEEEDSPVDDSQMLVQLSEGSGDRLENAIPQYHQRAEQARIKSENDKRAMFEHHVASHRMDE